MAINGISGLAGSMLSRHMMQTQLELLETYERLSTGLRINRASDDPAGIGMAARLEAEQRAIAMAERNVQVGISMVRTAEGYLGGISEDIQRIRELSVQAANGTLTTTDREAIQQEINALRENISYTISSAEFNSKNLFAGRTEVFQIGPDASSQLAVEFPALSLESLGLNEIDVTTQTGAEAAITAASVALDGVLEIRTNFGAVENRLDSTLGTLSVTRLNTLRSLSEIQDANMALEIINATRSLTKLQAQMMVTAQIFKLEGSLIMRLLE